MGISIPIWRAAAQTSVPGGTATGISSIVRWTNSSFFSSSGIVLTVYILKIITFIFLTPHPVFISLLPAREEHGDPCGRHYHITVPGYLTCIVVATLAVAMLLTPSNLRV